MPFPTDEKLLQTAKDLLSQMQAIFGSYPGIRPGHAKGITLTGTFTPSEEVKKLSIAPHFNNPSTPIWVRFSNSTGLPKIPDFDPNADPRGMGIRFILGDHKHTDIISVSTPLFPVRTGEEFLKFLQAAATGTVGPFLEANPQAMAAVTAPKPAPVSYGTQQYFAVHAFKLIDSEGKETVIRYHIVPDAGVQTLDAETVQKEDPDYLSKDIVERVAKGPVMFKLQAQIAQEGDVTDDATNIWPADRRIVTLGTIKVEGVLPDYEKEAKHFILDPIPRVQGVEASDDPLLEMRAAIYLFSGKQRRAA